MATTSTSYRSGEFLRLSCDVASNSNLTVGDLKALNNPVLLTKAVGSDQLNSYNLTGKVRVRVEVLQ